jgi:hypothetical protein
VRPEISLYKQTFPALAALAAHGRLDMPIVLSGRQLRRVTVATAESLAETGASSVYVSGGLTGSAVDGSIRRCLSPSGRSST